MRAPKLLLGLTTRTATTHMSKRFKVFLGAPAPEDTSSKFSWQHAQSHPTPSESPGFSSYVLDASRRISTIYQNIVFKDDDGGESLLELGDEPMSPTSRLLDETTRYGEWTDTRHLSVTSVGW